MVRSSNFARKTIRFNINPDAGAVAAAASNATDGNQSPQREPRKQAQPKKNNNGVRQNRVLEEIRQLQESRKFIIPRLALYRLVKEIMKEEDYGAQGLRIQRLALEAIQQAAEAFLVNMFEDCNILAVHAKRVTVMPKDLQVLKRLHASMHMYKKL